MDDLIDGVKEMVSIEGVGNYFVIFALLTAGAYFGFTPVTAADWVAGMLSGSQAA